ncbi:M36 family metallopeptidase [Nocardioides marmotae]|uniref:M36 family metallopeptidase n=1 Tax=Nocardioides marmotae TaxID=2663857 RepID=UPI00149619E5|nr:M36 family metallopeptidase [Nocardioides marmotae]QKE01195.1 coagulation factor 5/8 type-like protein [Nocardioides marmotae]
MVRSRTSLAAVVGLAAIAAPTLSVTGSADAASAPVPAPAPAARTSGPVAGLVGDLRTLAYDARRALPALGPTTAQRTAARSLGASVTWGSAGTPRAVWKDSGPLTGPRAGDPVDIARGWLRSQTALIGIDADDVDALEVVRDHELPGIGARVVSFAQTFGGVAAGYGGVLTVVTDRDGRVVSYAGNPVRPSRLVGSFELSPAKAIGTVLDAVAPALDVVVKALGRKQGGYDVFDAGPLADVLRVRRIAFPMADGARAAYAVLVVKSMHEAYVQVVDAASGEPLLRKSLVQHAEGTVYENYPGAPKGGKPVTKSFGRTPQSPKGWVDVTGLLGTGITTLGNNADTVNAWTVPLVPVDQAIRPIAPTGSFDFAFPDAWRGTKGATGSWVRDANAAAVNLFYHHNRIHDEFYEFGFTETAGNFQLDNFGKGGLGGDLILGGAQSGATGLTDPILGLGRNNANMITLPDGIPGITNMYLWNPVDDAFEGPYRDGDFDATIIQHEYAHGLSNRYVGGGGLGALGVVQGGSMGEGWGDWFAMNHLFREGLSRTAVTAAYVGDKKRGIRNWNYAEHPTTFGDIGYDTSGPEVHSDGEIWTATLWDLRTAILRAVGGDQRRASDISQHLVMDAMPISAPEPSFLDMRDAILRASRLRYGKKYDDLIWAVFAKRGMGASARTKGEADTDPKPGFDAKRAAQNGRLRLRVLNASAGGPVAGVRVLPGVFEARATPVDTTDKGGRASATMTPGRYTLTLQAPGFGIQRFPVTIERGRTLDKTIRLRPNLLSELSGAKVTKVSSENPALPAAGMFDDTEASSYQTGPQDAAYVDGPKASVIARLKKPSLVDTVHVSVMKPPTLPRFAAADKVRVQTSTDGKRWRTVTTATFSFKQPRPTVGDQMLKTYRLQRPVKARFVRVTPLSTFGDGAENASTAIISEVQVFGRAPGISPTEPKPDKPVTSAGSVAVGNPTQGSLLGLDPYRPGVTELTWAASCPGLPPANGSDAWFTKLPEGSADGKHTITYTGSVPIGEWLLYWYGPDCAPITGDFGYFDEAVTIPPGAAYAGFLLIYGAGASFDVTVREPR